MPRWPDRLPRRHLRGAEGWLCPPSTRLSNRLKTFLIRLALGPSFQPIASTRFPDFYGISTDSLPRSVRWFGPPARAHQFIHIPDAAHAVRLLAEDVQTAGDVWHVTGAEPITGYQLRDMAREVTAHAARLTVMSPGLVRLMGLGFAPARGLVETQYLWRQPMLLDQTQFATRFGTHFIHTHREALQAIVNAKGSEAGSDTNEGHRHLTQSLSSRGAL